MSIKNDFSDEGKAPEAVRLVARKKNKYYTKRSCYCCFEERIILLHPQN